MEWLQKVCDEHKLWLKIMHQFGAKEFSEDYVQDMYIRIAERSSKDKCIKNGKVNKSYIFFVLRNTYINNLRKQRGNNEKGYIKYVYFNPDILKYEENFYIGGKKYSGEILESENTEIQLKEIKEEKEAYDILLYKIHKEMKTWYWYDVMLFSIYVFQDVSIRKLEKESGISYFSIFHTLKNCKERLKLAIGEDWQDFKNLDYRFIKL